MAVAQIYSLDSRCRKYNLEWLPTYPVPAVEDGANIKRHACLTPAFRHVSLTALGGK